MMPRQIAVAVASTTRQISRRTAAANDNDNDNDDGDGYQDEEQDNLTQGVWALERPGFRRPQQQQQQQRPSNNMRNSSRSVKTRETRAASVDSAFSVHRELYDEDEGEGEEEEQNYGHSTKAAEPIYPPPRTAAPVPSLANFGRVPAGTNVVHKKPTITATTVPQKRTRAYSDTDTQAQNHRKQTIVAASKNHNLHSRSGRVTKMDPRQRRKSDAAVHFKKTPLVGLSGMNQDSQASVDHGDMDMEMESEVEDKTLVDRAAGASGEEGGAASSQEYENVGLQDLARIERSTIHKPIIIEHTLSEQAEPLVHELEDAYANQWQDTLSEKDSELYATANALGNIVLIDSLKVAEVVSECGDRVLGINEKVAKAVYDETHAGTELMSKLMAKQKALVEKLNDNYARCKAREEKVFQDMQAIRDKTSTTLDDANATYISSANDIEEKMKKLVNEKNLQAQFNNYLLKATTGAVKIGAGAGGKKKGAAK